MFCLQLQIQLLIGSKFDYDYYNKENGQNVLDCGRLLQFTEV